ncbi:MAG: conjugal transfer protein TraI, partial [Paracoccus denitrificans]
MSDIDPDKSAKPEPTPDDDEARPLTGEPVTPMRLRAEPPRVTRLSRKVLAGLGLVGSLSIGGALIYALQTRDGGRQEELISTDNRSTPDGLAGLPKDYTGPVLGPALPGDLGRPILDAQNRGQPVPASGMVAPQPGVSAEEQRLLQELEAARTARLFASTETRTATPVIATANATPPPIPDLTGVGLAPQPATPSAQDRQLAFLNQTPDKRTVAPDRVAAPASPNILQAGAVIPAALITGIRSDLPGQITAQVTENVYDSPTGRILLVPQGTRLI